MTKKDIQPSEYNEYFGRYINLVSDETQLLQGLENDKKFVTDFFSSIPKEKLEYRYQPKNGLLKRFYNI